MKKHSKKKQILIGSICLFLFMLITYLGDNYKEIFKSNVYIEEKKYVLKLELLDFFFLSNRGSSLNIEYFIKQNDIKVKFTLKEKDDTITYRIIYKNNSLKSIKFNSLDFEYLSPDSRVSHEISGISTGEIIKANESITIDIKFKYKEEVMQDEIITEEVNIKPIFTISEDE